MRSSRRDLTILWCESTKDHRTLYEVVTSNTNSEPSPQNALMTYFPTDLEPACCGWEAHKKIYRPTGRGLGEYL